MIVVQESALQQFLNQHDEQKWARALESLLPAIHPVDQPATRVWFSFWPLKLASALRNGEEKQVRKDFQLDGCFRLEEQVASSVLFLYGSRHWVEMRDEILKYAETCLQPEVQTLEKHIEEVASRLSLRLHVPRSVLLGIAAVGFMILQQVGPVGLAADSDTRSALPDQSLTWNDVLKKRNRESGSGFLQWLTGGDRRYPVVFDEQNPESTFTALKGQDLSMACSADKRDYRSRDPRRIDGPIPAQCRSGACGYCWIGVIAGQDRLSELTDFEERRLRHFGYRWLDAKEDRHPVIRLACQSKCYGAVSIVIPPWNGVLSGRA
ncbi:MAG: 2Fe-2S iron-sulfur cluster-binding protein [Acidobacteriota bacterium]